MIRVFIADDHPIVRYGLRRLLEEQDDMSVVGEASTGRQVLQAEGRGEWDVLLLDLSLPQVGGIEVLRRLQLEVPRPRVVVVSAYPDEQYALHALREGAVAYVHKDEPPGSLLLAVRSAASGGTRVPESVLDQIREQRQRLPHERLSPREYQTFMLLIQGHTVSEIAAQLDITASTVSNHVTHIKEKLKTRSLGETINYAHRVGLVGDTG
jgi:DNA-binding NarL/FixJ family response regulator